MRLIVKTSFLVCLMLSNVEAATCLRCQKIEEERSKEQALHPHQVGYYEDEIGLMNDKEEPGKAAQTLKPIPSAEPAVKENEKKAAPSNGNHLDKAIPLTPTPPPIQSQSVPAYSTIAIILQTEGLKEALKGEFTIILPANEAFRSLPIGSLENLLRPENSMRLQEFVRNHVLTIKLNPDLIPQEVIRTLNGKSVHLMSEGNERKINGAKIIGMKPLTENGVMVIVDRLLFPISN